MSYELKVSARFPVLVRVFTDAGEVVGHLARSARSAEGYVRYHVQEGHWFGQVTRVEYEYYTGYNGLY